jgi:hypothetical protein
VIVYFFLFLQVIFRFCKVFVFSQLPGTCRA